MALCPVTSQLPSYTYCDTDKKLISLRYLFHIITECIMVYDDDDVQARKLCEKHSGYLADIQSDGELLELNRVLNLDQKKHFFPYWILKYGTSDYHGGWCSNSQSDSSQCSFLKV